MATTARAATAAFPRPSPGQQEQVRSTLADSLRAVDCLHLLKTRDGQGGVLAVEILFNNEAVSNLIRKGKSFQIPSVIATSREQGMQLMDQDLMRLYKEGRITAEDAYMKAVSKKDFEVFLEEEVAAKPLPGRAAQAQGTPHPPRPPVKPPVQGPRPAAKPTGS